jgi:hypothetical protein
MRENNAGDPRYVVSASIAPVTAGNEADNEPYLSGVASVPTTEDALIAFSHPSISSGNSPIAKMKIYSDRQEQGAWALVGAESLQLFGGDVIRLNDSPGSPALPLVAWFMRYEHNAANAGHGYLNHFMSPPVVDPSSDAFVITGRSNQAAAGQVVEWGRSEPNKFVLNPIDPAAKNASFAHTAILIFGGRYSNGDPTWVNVVETGSGGGTPGRSQALGHPYRRGREWAVPMVGTNGLVFDPLGPFELVRAIIGKEHGVAYYDITSGEFKRWEVLHATNADDELSPPWLVSNHADIKTDLPDEVAIIGVPFTSTLPEVENHDPGGTLTFTKIGDDPAASSLTLNSATGVVEGTPGLAGSYEMITRVDETDGGHSASNRWRLWVMASAPTIGDYPDIQCHAFGTAITPFTPTGTGTFFKVVAGQLPDGIALNSATGELTGTPTEWALMHGTPGETLGTYSGIVIEANGTAQSAPFSIQLVGVPMPAPDFYWSGNNTHDEETTPIAATVDAGTKTYRTVATKTGMDYKSGADRMSYGTPLGAAINDFSIAMTWQGDHANMTSFEYGMFGAANVDEVIVVTTGGAYVRATGFAYVGVSAPTSGRTGATYSDVFSRGGGFIKRGKNGEVPNSVAEGVGAIDLSAATLKMGIGSGIFGPNGYDGGLAEVAFWDGVDLDQDQRVTIEWLRQAGITIDLWTTPFAYCPPTFTESFEFADGGWPGTIADPFPTPTFATPTFTESFEFAEGWPGTAP